jgi:glycosyltransferase involved in cell wall biosynthesis
MRILMLLENEYRKDVRVEKEVQTLFKAGHEVIVAAITFSGLNYKEKRENCTVLRKNISKFILKSSVGALKFPFYFNFWRSYVRDIFKEYKVDAIHVHDLPLCQIGIEAKKLNKVKLVLDLHENWPALLGVSSHINTFLGKILSSDKQWRRYEKHCVLEADYIICVVNEMKVRISKLGIPAGKICIIENTPKDNSIDEVKFERDLRYYTLIYIGGISFHRGLQYVINGIRLLVPELPVRLWITGDGKYSKYLKDQVKSMQLEDYVEFFGLVTKEKSQDLLKKSDLGLIPHIRSEQSDNSSPNKLFEYMAAGLPVLASDCISVKRVITETNTGMTYVFDSPSDFARVVRELYNDRERSDIFSINGKKAIREQYNWQQSSASLVNLYSDPE